MKIIDRLNIIREDYGLNKSQFERKISKSTGYINMLEKRGSHPGVDVMLKIVEVFPDYSLIWLMTGQGDKLNSDRKKMTVVNEPVTDYGNNMTLLDVRDDIKKDLKTIYDGLNINFKTLSTGVLEVLKDTRKISEFIEELNPKEIKEAGAELTRFLQEQK